MAGHPVYVEAEISFMHGSCKRLCHRSKLMGSESPGLRQEKNTELGQKLHNFFARLLFRTIMQVFSDQHGTATSPTGYRPHRIDHSRCELYSAVSDCGNSISSKRHD